MPVLPRCCLSPAYFRPCCFYTNPGVLKGLPFPKYSFPPSLLLLMESPSGRPDEMPQVESCLFCLPGQEWGAAAWEMCVCVWHWRTQLWLPPQPQGLCHMAKEGCRGIEWQSTHEAQLLPYLLCLFSCSMSATSHASPALSLYFSVAHLEVASSQPTLTAAPERPRE